jgi:hypothetical protein
MVGNHDVPFRREESLLEVFPVVDPLVDEAETTARELLYQQVRVVFAVFNDEQPNFSAQGIGVYNWCHEALRLPLAGRRNGAVPE